MRRCLASMPLMRMAGMMRCSTTPPSSTEGKPAAAANTNPKATSTPVAGPTDATTASAEGQQFPTNELLAAVKAGDFAKMQGHATHLVQRSWKEEYTIPAGCIVFFVIVWYWMAWTRRSIRRQCAAVEAALKQEAEQTLDVVAQLTEKWSKNISRSNDQMQAVIDKNSALTADIDRMTTALRSCSIRPTPVVQAPSVESTSGKMIPSHDSVEPLPMLQLPLLFMRDQFYLDPHVRRIEHSSYHVEEGDADSFTELSSHHHACAQASRDEHSFVHQLEAAKTSGCNPSRTSSIEFIARTMKSVEVLRAAIRVKRHEREEEERALIEAALSIRRALRPHSRCTPLHKRLWRSGLSSSQPSLPCRNGEVKSATEEQRREGGNQPIKAPSHPDDVPHVLEDSHRSSVVKDVPQRASAETDHRPMEQHTKKRSCMERHAPFRESAAAVLMCSSTTTVEQTVTADAVVRRSPATHTHSLKAIPSRRLWAVNAADATTHRSGGCSTSCMYYRYRMLRANVARQLYRRFFTTWLMAVRERALTHSCCLPDDACADGDATQKPQSLDALAPTSASHQRRRGGAPRRVSFASLGSQPAPHVEMIHIFIDEL